MSKYFSKRFATLEPYTPGEQPKDLKYIKLNTNESPFGPTDKAVKAAEEAAKRLHLYPDPDCTDLVAKLAEIYDIDKDEIILTNGSDEILNFAFMAFCDDEREAVFPKTTYSFYKVFAELNHIKYEEIPLEDDFTIDTTKYYGKGKTILIANPNAPTGIAITLDQIEEILKQNPDNVVIIDEAYVDFGGDSAVPLTKKYDNLLVTQTFSKSRSMAGARLGYGIGSKALIADLNTIKYSTNPYNINSLTMAAAIGMLEDEDIRKDRCNYIIETREYTKKRLAELGFTFTDSKTNFVFAKHESVSGQEIYEKLKADGVLIRHFSDPLIADYNRITIGMKEDMDVLFEKVEKILEGK